MKILPNYQLIFWLFIGFFVPTSNLSADWDMGGGEKVGDTDNPWFEEQTKEVRFCISVDNDFFIPEIETHNINTKIHNFTEDEISLLVEKAIQYWKNQFNIMYLGSNNTRNKIATQNFIYIGTCSESIKLNKVDIKIQLGVLFTKKQREFFKENTYIGATVRESYDQIEKKAKGFIYIGNPQNIYDYPEEVKNIWAQNNNLLFMLIHEFGHVFGINHTNFEGHSIMAREFPYNLIKNKYLNRKNTNFFRPTEGTEYKNCGLNKDGAEKDTKALIFNLLKISNKAKCIKIILKKIKRHNGESKLEVFTSNSIFSPYVLQGKISAFLDVETREFGSFYIRSKPELNSSQSLSDEFETNSTWKYFVNYGFGFYKPAATTSNTNTTLKGTLVTVKFNPVSISIGSIDTKSISTETKYHSAVIFGVSYLSDTESSENYISPDFDRNY